MLCLWVLAPVSARVCCNGLKSSASPLDSSPHFITCTDFGLHPGNHSESGEREQEPVRIPTPATQYLPQLNAGANTRVAFGWIRESASQRHPDKRLRRVVHHAASLLEVGLHAAKSGGRGQSERAAGGGAPPKPRHSRGRSPIFPVSRPSCFPGCPGYALDPSVHVVAVVHMDRAHTRQT